MLTDSSKILVINKNSYELESVSTFDISKYRKKLVDSALEIIL